MINFQGTELMQVASGEAKVQNKGNRMKSKQNSWPRRRHQVRSRVSDLRLVAVSPQWPRCESLGEVVLKSGAGQVKAITDMQTFAMLVHRLEPLFRGQPAWPTPFVLENVFGPTTLGKVENHRRQLRAPGPRHLFFLNTKIENAIVPASTAKHRSNFSKRATPFESRASPLADKYAASTFSKAEQQLRNAEEVYAARATKNPSKPPRAKRSAPPKKLASWPSNKRPKKTRKPKSRREKRAAVNRARKPGPARTPLPKSSAARKLYQARAQSRSCQATPSNA